MKKLLSIQILLLAAIVGTTGCQSTKNQDSMLLMRLDSMQIKLNNAYKPGIGEIMNGTIQPHHLKLWLAGEQNNWVLAQYELHQLSGGFKKIELFDKSKPESAFVPMIYPELAAIEKTIAQQDAAEFKKHYAILTQVCNNCHQGTKYKFNVIEVPSSITSGNQHF